MDLIMNAIKQGYVIIKKQPIYTVQLSCQQVISIFQTQKKRIITDPHIL